jgi:hypothetical protein
MAVPVSEVLQRYICHDGVQRECGYTHECVQCECGHIHDGVQCDCEKTHSIPCAIERNAPFHCTCTTAAT